MTIPAAIKNMASYAIGLFLIKGLSLLMLPVVANYLAPAQLGKLELLASIGTFIGLLIGLAMHEALYRFAGDKQSEPERFNIASHLFKTTLLLSVCACGLLLFIANSAPVLSILPVSQLELNIVLTSISLEGAIGIGLAWLRMQDKVHAFLKICISTSVLQVMLVVTVLYTAPSVANILLASFIAHLVQLLGIGLYNKFSWRIKQAAPLSRYWAYSIPIMLSGLVAFGLNGAERWLLAASTSLTELGQYAIAAKFSLAMCILVQPFGMWWMPKRFHYLSYVGAIKTRTITQYGLLLISLLTVLIAGAGQCFILLALPELYHDAGNLLIATLAIAWCKEVAELTNVGILHHKKTKHLLSINLACTLVGLCTALALGQYGIWAILGSLFFAQFIRALAITYVSQRLERLPYQIYELSAVFVVTFAMLGVYTQELSATSLAALSLLSPVLLLLLASWLRLIPTLHCFNWQVMIQRLSGRTQ